MGANDSGTNSHNESGDARPQYPGPRTCPWCKKKFDGYEAYTAHECPGPSLRDALAESSGDLTSQVVKVLRFVYAQNPFYLASAVLILLGLNALLGTSARSANAWTLVGVLSGYTALLAGTALLIVRLGRVWDDARSILLIIVLLLLATSVSFDEILNREALAQNRMVGVWPLGCGFIFSVVLSEILLRGLRIRLPTLFRLPYYAVLTLFFAYPPLLQWLLIRDDIAMVQLALFAFTPVAGALFLLLIPAVRSGRDHVRDNGTPWSWPWFPWALFALLGFGVCVRSYYITLSFHAARGMESIFGLYFLVPFIFAAALILLELGIVARKPAVQTAALLMPLMSVLISFPGSSFSQTYTDFVKIFCSAFGSPVVLAAVGATLFAAYAWIRGVRFAPVALAVAFSITSLTRSTTLGVDNLAAPCDCVRGLPPHRRPVPGPDRAGCPVHYRGDSLPGPRPDARKLDDVCGPVRYATAVGHPDHLGDGPVLVRAVGEKRVLPARWHCRRHGRSHRSGATFLRQAREIIRAGHRRAVLLVGAVVPGCLHYQHGEDQRPDTRLGRADSRGVHAPSAHDAGGNLTGGCTMTRLKHFPAPVVACRCPLR